MWTIINVQWSSVDKRAIIESKSTNSKTKVKLSTVSYIGVPRFVYQRTREAPARGLLHLWERSEFYSGCCTYVPRTQSSAAFSLRFNNAKTIPNPSKNSWPRLRFPWNRRLAHKTSLSWTTLGFQNTEMVTVLSSLVTKFKLVK